VAKSKPKMPRITEAEFTTQVIQLARLYGWTVHHQLPGMTKRGWRSSIQGDKGLPDIIAVKKGRKICAELKVGKNKPTPEQLRWLREWGEDAYVWYPADWDKLYALFTGEH
jgi:hypothetical protein